MQFCSVSTLPDKQSLFWKTIFYICEIIYKQKPWFSPAKFAKIAATLDCLALQANQVRWTTGESPPKFPLILRLRISSCASVILTAKILKQWSKLNTVWRIKVRNVWFTKFHSQFQSAEIGYHQICQKCQQYFIVQCFCIIFREKGPRTNVCLDAVEIFRENELPVATRWRLRKRQSVSLWTTKITLFFRENVNSLVDVNRT